MPASCQLASCALVRHTATLLHEVLESWTEWRQGAHQLHEVGLPRLVPESAGRHHAMVLLPGSHCLRVCAVSVARMASAARKQHWSHLGRVLVKVGGLLSLGLHVALVRQVLVQLLHVGP